MSRRITVSNGETPIYDTVLETSFDGLAEEVEKISSSTGHKICVVADSTVAELYLEAVKSALQGCGSQVISFVFPAGEEYKNLNVVRDLYEQLILAQFARKDLLVALGGGVTGDLTGFAAATYLRGIDFIQIPTTLLAQTDSSIGGKTGVDFKAYKNMVGAFHQPLLCFMNIETLSTLDRRQFLSGLGEVIKAALIKDRTFYEWIKDNFEKINALDKDILEEMIFRACLIKRDVVQKDPTEKGERALLNFGHTLGHAIERCAGFSLYHGECVVLGMIAALHISKERGCLTEEEFKDAYDLFKAFGYDLKVSGLSKTDILETVRSDKKAEEGIVKFILLESIGEGVIKKDITKEEQDMALDVILE